MRVHSRWLEHTDLRIPHFDVPRAVHDIYPDLSHALDWEQAIAATSFVPDEVIAQLADALGLVGTPEHCAKRIIDLAGARHLEPLPHGIPDVRRPSRRCEFPRRGVPRLKAAGYR